MPSRPTVRILIYDVYLGAFADVQPSDMYVEKEPREARRKMIFCGQLSQYYNYLKMLTGLKVFHLPQPHY